MTKHKAVCISDTHLKDISLPEGDFLFHCGDYLMGGTFEEWYRNMEWIRRERPKFKHWVTTFGNHDKYCKSNLNLVKEELLREKVVALVDEGLHIDGLHIYGSPWVATINGMWAWECPKGGTLKDKWDNIPNGLDVLLTHGPPYGITDQSIKPFTGKLSPHYGCWNLKARVTTMEDPPRYHLFGHIHQTPAQEKIVNNYGITKFVNAALLDDYYEVVNEPIVLEIES